MRMSVRRRMEMIMDRKSKKKRKKCSKCIRLKNNGKIHAYYFFESTKTKNEVASLLLVWFWSSKCTAEDGSLFKQCACKLVCVLKTWFKQTQKHSRHASNLQQSVFHIFLIFFVLLSKFRPEWVEKHTKQEMKWWRSHATSNTQLPSINWWLNL